jgi:hypothetical protein
MLREFASPPRLVCFEFPAVSAATGTAPLETHFNAINEGKAFFAPAAGAAASASAAGAASAPVAAPATASVTSPASTPGPVPVPVLKLTPAATPVTAADPVQRLWILVRPDFDSVAVDVVGCGNTFGSLLSACRLHDERTFNFGVERAGSTIFLVQQTSPGELIENVRGYGHSFPDAYTTWPRDVKGSASHQRLIQYNFGCLRCIIRSESDGYLPDKLSTVHNSSVPETDEKTIDVAINSLTVVHAVKATSSRLSVQSAGQLVPQEVIFDVKTRSI